MQVKIQMSGMILMCTHAVECSAASFALFVQMIVRSAKIAFKKVHVKRTELLFSAKVG